MTYCKAPFVAYTVNYDSSVRPCPHFSRTFPIKEGQTLDEIWQNHELKKVRRHYEKSTEPLPECRRCQNNDRLDVFARHRSYHRYEVSENPRWLDLRLSNLCNLKCRTCSSDFSSKWIAENSFLKSENYIHGADKFYPPQFQQLEEALARSDLDVLEIKGGEPFLVLSQYLKTRSPSPQIPCLKLTTNGTIPPDENLRRFFMKFNQVEIKLSVDSVRDAFRPLRGSDIFQIESFLKSTQEISSVEIKIQTVVSAYSVFELPHLAVWHNNWRQKLDPQRLLPLTFDNFLVIPEYLSARVHPPDVRIKLTEKFENLEKESDLFQCLAPTRTFLSEDSTQYDENLHSQFWSFTRLLDKVRSENFAATLKREIDFL